MDIQALYPSRGIIREKTERIEPEYYNYMCVHGYQLYIRSFKKYYQVLTCSWYPSFADKDKYRFTDKLHVVIETRVWIDALKCFKACAQELARAIDYGDLF